MGKINRLLLMLIAMVAIMIAAVGIDRGIEYYRLRRWEKERVQQYEETYAQAAALQMTIEELSQDQQAIESFIEENQEYFRELEAMELQSEAEQIIVSENPEDAVLPNGSEEMSISENNVPYEDPEETGSVSANEIADTDPEDTVSENSVSENTVSGNDTEGSVSENTVSGNDTDGSVSENTVSDNDLEGDVSENALTDSGIEENGIQSTVSGNDLTLQERRKRNSSYIETQSVNRADKQIIAGSTIDFSDIKITCLGDSITAATNLDKMENYQQYAYPARLQEILGAKEVVNLGIGGSSIGRYWADAFVDRYQEIPEDTDVILVMGGTNDGFCLSREDMGTLEDRKERTFIGDLDELMRGLKEDYPDAMIVFATPLPNVLHDMLRKERDYLLSQKEIADAIRILAAEHQIPVIDLYNSNILDSHDAAVIFNYMPDGVHGNQDGYQVLAEHMAAQLIGLLEGNKE